MLRANELAESFFVCTQALRHSDPGGIRWGLALVCVSRRLGKEALAAVNTAAQDAHELVNALTGLVLHCVKDLR